MEKDTPAEDVAGWMLCRLEAAVTSNLFAGRLEFGAHHELEHVSFKACNPIAPSPGQRPAASTVHLSNMGSRPWGREQGSCLSRSTLHLPRWHKLTTSQTDRKRVPSIQGAAMWRSVSRSVMQHATMPLDLPSIAAVRSTVLNMFLLRQLGSKLFLSHGILSTGTVDRHVLSKKIQTIVKH